jgi:outer membrane protein OmpA-like peptidoglycan-associated protein
MARAMLFDSVMRIALVLAGVLAATAPAVADPRAPTGPDFLQNPPAERSVIDSDLAASFGSNALLPATLLLFRNDSIELGAAERAEIASAAAWLRENPNKVLIVEAHASRIGTDDYNADLSARRGDRVRAMLVTLGADPRRIVVGAFGEAMAHSPNPAANRRVILRASSLPVADLLAGAVLAPRNGRAGR